MTKLEEKEQILEQYLESLGSVAVAFSSGVDSTFLLKKAHQVLGGRVIAVTARSCSFPVRELNEAQDFCRREQIRQIVVESEELAIPGFSSNPRNRCYLCKRELFEKLKEVAAQEGMAEVVEGSNVDDLGDYRPGLIAIEELGIKSPLRYAGLGKEEIRELSRRLGLATWNKQSFACLASRFVYGETITEGKLGMVDRAEQLLLDLGFGQVRVRIHGEDLARIEVGSDEVGRFAEEAVRGRVVEAFREIGFQYVTLDLQGYRTGSMNGTLPAEHTDAR